MKGHINYDGINSSCDCNYNTGLLVILGRRIMNQKFGDMFAKFLFVFFIWTVIAFIFNIGW